MDYKKCCELLKPLYGKNNDYGLFREDLTDAEKSNLERNLDGGACFHWKGVIPFNGYDFYTSNETAFRNTLIREGENGKSSMIKSWEQLTKDQQQHVVNYCNQLYQNASSEETYVADQIMMTINPIYEQSFANKEPQLDQKLKGTGAAAGAIGGALTGAIGGAKCGIPGGPGGILVASIAGAGIGAYAGFKLQNGGNFTYADKRGPTLLKQVQDELDGKTLQNQQEKTNTQSRQKEQEIAKINEERQKEERQKEERQKEQEEKQKKEEDQRKNEENQRKKEEEREKEKDSTKITDSLLKDINLSLKDTNQPATVKGKKGQVTTSPENLQNLNQNLNAIRQKITEETQNSANVPAAVDTSSLENDKSLQTAMAVKEQGSWWSRNWDILAIIGGALGALGLGAWLIKRQKDKTKKAKAEASTLANQVSSLNSKVSSLTEALNTQSNQPATNTGTNTETNTSTGTNTSGGSTLENSGSSVSDSTVDKGRPTKIVIKGKTSAEME